MVGPGAMRTLPLAGVRVIEIGHSLSAPYTGHILGQLGATVTKIENIDVGDHARGWGTVRYGDAAVMFHAVNVGKRSVTADFRDPSSVERIAKLIIGEGDIVIQNVKRGSLERVHLDAATLRKAKPSLIYCNISAFGSLGPLRDQPGYDPLIQAVSGMMSLIGRAGEPSIRIPISLNDMGTGMWACMGILATYIERLRTGIGATIDTSLYETALAWQTVQISDYLNSGIAPERHGSGNANIVPYQTFFCQGGEELMIAAGNDKLFQSLCGILGLPDLRCDARFTTNDTRVLNRRELIAALQAAIAERDRAGLEAELRSAGVPCGKINTIDQVVDSAQAEALGILGATSGNELRTVGIPLTIDDRRPPIGPPGPNLGAHDSGEGEHHHVA
jgi:crotonobetainyl-CoA:carnitine CoA-transferase CaiB-like acyl-CoA transferase